LGWGGGGTLRPAGDLPKDEVKEIVAIASTEPTEIGAKSPIQAQIVVEFGVKSSNLGPGKLSSKQSNRVEIYMC
jgi:hypothetical protein